MRRTRLAVLAVALLSGGARADACCMVPLGYRGDVDQSWQRGVVVHHDGHEELILRIQPHFHGEEGPAFLEWVVTVPSSPTGYATVDGEPVDDAVRLHDRLQDLADQQFQARTRFEMPVGGAGRMVARESVPSHSASLGGLEIGAPTRVGPFEITPVVARGMEGLVELNGYLGKRGFAPEDAGHMKWFVDRQFTFLCIHITPPKGEGSVGKVLDLPALRIGFDAERPYYPAKFSSRQGDFGLRLAVVTSRPLERAALRKQRERLQAPKGSSRYDNLWSVAAPPKGVADAFPASGPHGVPERWHVNVLESRGFNPTVDGKPTIWSWDDDVFFPLGGEADEPPSWYYGDRDVSGVERFLREHGIAAGAGAGALALVVLGVWLRRRRRARRAA